MNRKITALSAAWLAAFSLAAFELRPVIFPADRVSTVTIRAVDEAEKKILAEMPLYYLSDHGTWSDGKRHGDSRWRPEWEKIELKKRGDGEATFTMNFRGEGWHTFRLGKPNEKWQFAPKETGEFMLYSLKPDLFELRPWKGDIHQHSIRCGHAKQEPQVIPAYNRLVGFDFMALSEHWRQAPSVEAIEAAKPWKCGLECFTGEEFHTPATMLHSVAVGHRAGINEWREKNLKEFNRRLEEELKKPIYGQYGLNADEKHQAAQSMVLYQVAREQGAKLIAYSHPSDFNRAGNFENPMEPFRRFMLDNADYDALELPNVSTGSPRVTIGAIDRLMLMNAVTVEQMTKERDFSIVAASDNHNQTLSYFGKVFTVIFAKACDVESFAAAVKDHRSLALRNVHHEQYLIFGPSRLMKYQQFLESFYWPEHDRLCRRQGELLLKRAAGDTSVQPEIEKLAAAIAEYRENCFAPAK